MTISLLRGRSREIFFRLFTLAPRIIILSFMSDPVFDRSQDPVDPGIRIASETLDFGKDRSGSIGEDTEWFIN